MLSDNIKKMLLTSAACALLAGCNNNAPSPPLPPVIVTPPAPSPSAFGSLIQMTWPSPLPNFYSPSIIFSGGVYQMWTTNGDRIALYESTDGRNWTGGDIVFSAIKGSWEDDGGVPFLGYQTGVSDPRIVKNVTPGYSHTMYYTGGHSPNTPTSGGIGVAVSNDGRHWDRVGSGLLRTYPDGNCFIKQAMAIRGKRYLYFLGGPGNLEPLLVADDVGNGYQFTNDRLAFAGAPGAVTPLFYDEVEDSCWIAIQIDVPGSATMPSGPTTFEIRKGSDGFSTLGTKVATVDPTVSGNKSNWYPQALQRGENGQRVGSGPVQIIFSSGNDWGNWQPASIIVV